MEVWKLVPNASKYEASNLGRVRLADGNKILKQYESKSYNKGYLCCRVCFDDGLITSRLVHRIIASTFLPNPKEQVNHKNGVKSDNRLENLEWVTRSENMLHMYSTGLKKYRPLHYKGKFGFEHNRSKAVVVKETGLCFGSMSEAGRNLGIDISSVSWSIKYKKPIFGMHFELIS